MPLMKENPRREVDPRDHRIADLKASLDRSLKARKALARERNRYLELLTKIAKGGGEYCDSCGGTGRSLDAYAFDSHTPEQLRELTGDEWDAFDDQYPDDCQADFCFGGFAVQVPE